MRRPRGRAREAPVGGRKPKAPKPEATKVGRAKAVLAATEALAGEAYTDAVGSDEVQAALEVIGNGRHPEAETPLGVTIHRGTEEADVAQEPAIA